MLTIPTEFRQIGADTSPQMSSAEQLIRLEKAWEVSQTRPVTLVGLPCLISGFHLCLTRNRHINLLDPFDPTSFYGSSSSTMARDLCHSLSLSSWKNNLILTNEQFTVGGLGNVLGDTLKGTTQTLGDTTKGVGNVAKDTTGGVADTARSTTGAQHDAQNPLGLSE